MPLFIKEDFSNGLTVVEYVAKYLGLENLSHHGDAHFLIDTMNSKIITMRFYMQQHLKFLTLFFLFPQ
ncbi:hypothetical protein wTkk_000782 [Wolbachia endosymbiont of Trichogramma kaykai]